MGNRSQPIGVPSRSPSCDGGQATDPCRATAAKPSAGARPAYATPDVHTTERIGKSGRQKNPKTGVAYLILSQLKAGSTPVVTDTKECPLGGSSGVGVNSLFELKAGPANATRFPDVNAAAAMPAANVGPRPMFRRRSFTKPRL